MVTEGGPIPEDPIESPEDLLAMMLKERGFEDPQVLASLRAWSDREERLTEQLTGRDYLVGQIELERRRGRLYLRAGYIEDACGAFNNVRDQAQNEGMTELYDAITDEIFLPAHD